MHEWTGTTFLHKRKGILKIGLQKYSSANDPSIFLAHPPPPKKKRKKRDRWPSQITHTTTKQKLKKKKTGSRTVEV